MRRPILMAVAAAVAAATLGFAPAQARTAQAPLALVTSESPVTQIRDDHRRWKKWRHADRHWKHNRHWKHRRHADRHWNHRRHYKRHHSSAFIVPFPFVAPYAFAPHQCYGRLVRTYDGRLRCIVY